MNDEQIADALVSAEVAWKVDDISYAIPEWMPAMYSQPANVFVNDWRVAGRCLQRWPTTINTEQLNMGLDEMLRSPRSICEAFASASDDQNAG